MSIDDTGKSDILQVEGVNSKGYGIIPKLVMQDGRISVVSKAIYSYFCSYAGAGRVAFPKVLKIIADLQISKASYYTHFNPLKTYGYIKVEQTRKDGRQSHNIYTIMDIIPKQTNLDNKPFSPCTKFQDTVFQDTVKQDTEIQDTEIQDPNNNSNYNNNRSKNNSIENYPPSPPQAGDGRTEKNDAKLPSMSNQSCADPVNQLSLLDQSSENLKLKTGGGEDENTSSQSMTLTEQRFEEFWAAYPRKVARKAVLKIWKRLNPSARFHTQILQAIELAKATEQWQRENGRYIPNPQTWINQGRWDDVYPSQIPQTKQEGTALSRLMAQIEADEAEQNNEVWRDCE